MCIFKEDKKVKSKILAILFVLIIFVGVVSSFANAQHATPPPVGWTPTPTPHGGGGGGGGGSGYTPPQDIYPKIIPVKNSLGNVVGNVTAVSAGDIKVAVAQKITLNGQEINVLIEAKLNSLPSDPKLDIVGETPDSSKLPAELTLKNIMAQVDLTRFSSGWSVQSGSLKLTLQLPKALAENADLGKSMLVRYDGAMYELLYPSVGGPDANGIITFTVVSPNEQFKYNGNSEYMLVTGTVATAQTPTPVPTAVSPTPGPEGLDPLTVLLALILVVLVAGAFVMYFMMQRKQ
jgi:flagellar basal body-associated protein FliL